ncbi:hypothetical protein [Flavobacterium sp. FlaQc-48]|uniref:hypothetical protein n=1 Tax=Flavobacterium sp. FlaQc-48 TaxID=3374181 RepID=UPI00375770B5
MKDNKLYTILDLIEEINKVDQMIEIHKTTDSALMLNQYSHKKLKLSGFLFKELLSNSGNSSEVMHVIKLFIEKFYSKELSNVNFEKDNDFKQIEDVFLQH